MLIQSDMKSFDFLFAKHVQIDVLGGRSTQQQVKNTDVVFYYAVLFFEHSGRGFEIICMHSEPP